MIVSLKFDTLRQTRWYEYAIRFVLGGLMTVCAGIIAHMYGPLIGGLFLAFPAIFPASATLIETHERERKEKFRLAGARRGKEAAALDAYGAALGSIGLLAFGCLFWVTVSTSIWLAFGSALGGWIAVSLLMWSLRKALRKPCAR
jgi:hypothetical protein